MASLPYPRCPPNSFHRTHSKFVCASPPTEFTEFTEASGGGYSPTDCTEYTEASGVEEPPTDAHRWLGCVGFSHGFHRIHRNDWRRRASHRFHRCAQMVRLRRLLWEDSFVAAWVWQGCHTLLICAYPCNLWENTLRQKLLWVLWLLWEDSLVAP